jgi:hypothetical protein
MAALPTELQALAERVAPSLACWQVVETLAGQPDAALAPHHLMLSSGLDIDAAEEAIAVLTERGIVSADPTCVALLSAHLPAIHALVGLMRADKAMRYALLKQAVRGQFRLTVTFIDEPRPHSLASSVPAVQDPSRSTDREAPAT